MYIMLRSAFYFIFTVFCQISLPPTLQLTDCCQWLSRLQDRREEMWIQIGNLEISIKVKFISAAAATVFSLGIAIITIDVTSSRRKHHICFLIFPHTSLKKISFALKRYQIHPREGVAGVILLPVTQWYYQPDGEEMERRERERQREGVK